MADVDAPRSPEAVREFLDRWLESANGGDWPAFADLLHPYVELRDPMLPEPARGRPAVLERAKAQYAPFPDGRTVMVGAPFASLAEPAIAYRWRFTGTHLRPVEPPGFAPTGRPVVVEGASFLRFVDGLVVADDLFFDTTGVARQLLAAPAAGSPLERVIARGQRLRVRLRGRGRP